MRFSLLECITIGSLSVTTIFGVAASICVTPGFIEKADLVNKVMSSVFTSEQMEAIQKKPVWKNLLLRHVILLYLEDA